MEEEGEEEEEEEEFICQVKNNTIVQTIEIHWQVAREGINPSMLATYDSYTRISDITERVG